MSYRNLLKPLQDYLIILVVFIPIVLLILIIMLGYLLSGEYPILFKHDRIGKSGKIFTLWKFRTLLSDGKKNLHERRFRWGTFLRFTNLDELPQLWNVLRGEMSLVGPRPMPVEYATLFSAEQNKRHQVRPGITGLAQVSGKNDLSWDEKFRLDLEYVKKVSFLLDMKILFKTLILVLRFRKDTSLSEEKFTG